MTIRSMPSNEAFRENWDRMEREKNSKPAPKPEPMTHTQMIDLIEEVTPIIGDIPREKLERVIAALKLEETRDRGDLT